MLIAQNVLLKWFDEWQKSTRSLANAGMAHETGLYGKWGWGDDNVPAKFHLHPLSRFARIHVSVQFGAKTQGQVTL